MKTDKLKQLKEELLNSPYFYYDDPIFKDELNGAYLLWFRIIAKINELEQQK